MDDLEVFVSEAVAVAMKAQEQGVARVKRTRQDLHDTAYALIQRAHDETRTRMLDGYIRAPPA